MPPHFLPKLTKMGYLAVKRQMNTTTYFDEYQKQFTEWQKQLSEWQKKFFDTWLESVPPGNIENSFSETFDKTLKLQEEQVKSYLEVQERTTRMMLEAQRKFWEDYFERMRKKPNANASLI